MLTQAENKRVDKIKKTLDAIHYGYADHVVTDDVAFLIRMIDLHTGTCTINYNEQCETGSCIVHISEEEAIKQQKETAAERGHTYENDQEALEHFLIIHWAWKTAGL